MRSNQFNIETLQDDGGLSSDSDGSDEEDEFVDALDTTPPSSSPLSRSPAEFTSGAEQQRPSSAAVLSISVNSPDTPTPGAIPTPVPNVGVIEPTPKAIAGFATPTSASGRFNPRNIVRKLSGLTGTPTSPMVEGPSGLVSAPPPIARSVSKEKRLFGKRGSGGYSSSSGGSSGTENNIAATPTTSLGALSVLGAGKRKESHYEYKKSHDIVGIVMLEIQGADNLPKCANSK